MKAKYLQFPVTGIVLVFCLYHLPALWLGSQSYFNAFDTLDSFVVWYRIVVQNGYAYSPAYTLIEPFMSGVPKFTLVSVYNLYYWLNLLLPTFQAYNLLMILTSAIALWGMFLLSRNWLGLDPLPAALISLSFAFTPFLPTWVFSIAGQPMLLFALLNLRKSKSEFWNWLIICLFPFTSNFQSAGVFILFFLALLISFDFWKKRPVRLLVIAFAVLLLLYLITKIDLVSNLLGGKGFVSHRSEMLRFPLSPIVCLKVFARYFVLGNIDVALSLHTFILLPFVLAVFIYSVIKYKTLPANLTFTLTVIILICIYIGALHWEPVVNIRNKSILLQMYSLERFHIFLPLLWHIAAAQAILLIVPRFTTHLVSGILAVQLVVCFAYQPTYYAVFFKKLVKIEPYHYIFKYDDYYATAMFELIGKQINKPLSTFRVASIGIPPAVAQYNGFWTIDGYSSNYPLSYKHAFRKIIASELEKNRTNKGFFDYWGSQCLIVYDQQLGYFETHMTKDLVPEQRDIVLSHAALKQLHCDYILSTENIENPEKSGLRQLGLFDSAKWRIHLYAVL